MNRLDSARRAQVIAALVEGNSIRATVRMTGVAKNTIAKLLVELGAACSEYMDRAMRNLRCRRVQVDEIWSFVGCKQKNVTEKRAAQGVCGDVWTWVAIDADTKLVPSWYVGQRDAIAATEFIADLERRLAHRIQLTSDRHRVYLNAVIDAFADEVDYAQLIKVYGNDPEAEKRYRPAQCIAARTEILLGDPDPGHISTSYVERQNLTIRMSVRRFTRLTNAFSKKIENHIAALAIHYMYYNFCRIHQTLRVSPAMAAGITDRLWSISDVVGLLESKFAVRCAA